MAAPFIRFLKPVGYWRFHLVPVPDPDEMNELGFRGPIDALYLRSLDGAAKEYAHFEIISLRTHEEVAGFARECSGSVGNGEGALPVRCRWRGKRGPFWRVKGTSATVTLWRGAGIKSRGVGRRLFLGRIVSRAFRLWRSIGFAFETEDNGSLDQAI